MNQQQILAALDDEIRKLQQVRNLLQSSGGGRLAGLAGYTKVKRRRLSAEARERIAAAQRRRWAKQKKQSAKK